MLSPPPPLTFLPVDWHLLLLKVSPSVAALPFNFYVQRSLTHTHAHTDTPHVLTHTGRSRGRKHNNSVHLKRQKYSKETKKNIFTH